MDDREMIGRERWVSTVCKCGSRWYRRAWKNGERCPLCGLTEDSAKE